MSWFGFLYNISLVYGRQASTRFICSLLSLPVPPTNPPGVKDNSTNYSTRSVPEYLEHGRVQKLLLFGMEGSGTATLFKQVCFFFFPFSFTSSIFLILCLIAAHIHTFLFLLTLVWRFVINIFGFPSLPDKGL